ncbi:MAG: hypothetical protein EAX96_00320 [Candidatus Lokiarchaeota archaeon]|nr:hypothetical protein [Candidatus Lokiarchaeota archaeon]
MTINNKKNASLLIIFISIPLMISVIYSITPAVIPSETFTGQITFMTYNIHFGVGMDDKLDLARIVQNILVGDPDIIGLQEVETGRITSEGVDMAMWLAKSLGMYYYYYPAVNEAGFGVTILSRYQIRNITTYDLPALKLERVLLHADVILNSTFVLDVFVTHLGLEDDNTTAQIEFILDKTNKVNGPKILMGDFNLNDTTNQIKNVTNFSVTHFNDTQKDFGSSGDTYPAYPSPYPGNRVDYIFASNFTAIINSKVVSDMIPGIHVPWEFGSDHLPVITTLQY